MRAGPYARRTFDLGCDFDTSEEDESAPLFYIEAKVVYTIYMYCHVCMCKLTSIFGQQLRKRKKTQVTM